MNWRLPILIQKIKIVAIFIANFGYPLYFKLNKDVSLFTIKGCFLYEKENTENTICRKCLDGFKKAVHIFYKVKLLPINTDEWNGVKMVTYKAEMNPYLCFAVARSFYTNTRYVEIDKDGEIVFYKIKQSNVDMNVMMTNEKKDTKGF